MKWIIVRTYANGKYMSKVYPIWFEWLSQAERMCKELNEFECEDGDKWIPMPIEQYMGSSIW